MVYTNQLQGISVVAMPAKDLTAVCLFMKLETQFL